MNINACCPAPAEDPPMRDHEAALFASSGFYSRLIIAFWYERATSRAIRFIVVGSCSPLSN